MFKIYDGREKFYQWDSNRQLIVEDPSVTEVHFCNRTDDCSLVCETYVKDGVTLVNVPNILLQNDWRIRVYAFDGFYTKHEKCYEVTSRTKPADYAYTETEVLNWQTINEKVEATISEVNKAEADRDSAETTRRIAEEARVIAENTRVSAEAERVTAETSREAKYNELIEKTTKVSEEADSTLVKVEGALVDTIAATENANTATATAIAAANSAYSKGNTAEEAANKANAATTNAIAATAETREATESTVNATNEAITAITQTNEATAAANEAANKANSAAIGINDKFANALKGSVSGKFIDVTDVSPVMHTINCTVECEDPTAVTITRGGSNLFDVSIKPLTVASSRVEVLEDNSLRVSVARTANYISVAYAYLDLECISNGTLYVSADVKKANATTGNAPSILIGVYNTSTSTSKTLGSFKPDSNGRIAGSCEVTEANTEGYDALRAVFYYNSNSTSGWEVGDYVDFSNIMISMDGAEYEPYKGETFTPDANGVVDITPFSPGMTIYTTTPDVVINLDYNRDINKAFAELQRAIVSLGGNV